MPDADVSIVGDDLIRIDGQEMALDPLRAICERDEDSCSERMDEWIAALAITEPGGGSDVAALKTTARRDGDHYVVNGSKTFITSGMRADTYTVAVRALCEFTAKAGDLDLRFTPSPTAVAHEGR